MRTILMFAVHVWTVLGAILAPMTATKLVVAWFAVCREIKKRGEVPPLFTLSPYGLKAFGGAFAAPIPCIKRMVICLQPSALKAMSYDELKFIVAHETGHCIGAQNKELFASYLAGNYTPGIPTLGGGVQRCHEIEADLVAGELCHFSNQKILAMRMAIFAYVAGVATKANPLMNEAIMAENVREQIDGVRDALGL